MTSLVEDLSEPPIGRVPFKTWMIARSPEERAALDAAASDPRWTDTALEMMLRRKHGVACSIDSIREWRAGVQSDI